MHGIQTETHLSRTLAFGHISLPYEWIKIATRYLMLELHYIEPLLMRSRAEWLAFHSDLWGSSYTPTLSLLLRQVPHHFCSTMLGFSAAWRQILFSEISVFQLIRNFIASKRGISDAYDYITNLCYGMTFMSLPERGENHSANRSVVHRNAVPWCNTNSYLISKSLGSDSNLGWYNWSIRNETNCQDD